MGPLDELHPRGLSLGYITANNQVSVLLLLLYEIMTVDGKVHNWYCWNDISLLVFDAHTLINSDHNKI